MNVFPTSGGATDDGWLATIGPYLGRNAYFGEDFATLYRQLALRNRWLLMSYTGLDTYDSPRQIRFGVEVGL